MRAARYHAQRDVRIEEIPEPELRPGTVAIDVAWCGICGTDLHEYLEGPIFFPAKGSPHPISGEEAPVTLGHEFSGTITALGEGVDDPEVGQGVVVEPYIIGDDVEVGPGHDDQLSPDMSFIGLGGRGGGLAPKIVVERRWVHPVGDVPLDQAALIEPLSVGHHAFVRSGAKAGDVAIVGGAGPIGLLTAAVLQASGLTVSVSELSAARKAMARDTGVADDVFDPREVDMPTLVLKEIDLRGTIGYANDHAATIALVQDGKIDLAPFITARIGLDGLVTEGFEQLITNNEHHVEILVDPNAS